MKYWTLEDIDWERFDASKVDSDLLKVVKAASLVEYNGGDYATYLCNVFHDDADFKQAVIAWAEEEVQHGRALGRWAELADPDFDFEARFRRFTDGYRLPLDATASVRGTRAGELVARCIVETGTSSYYTALAEAAEEPVLNQLCKNIAGDEFRHYKLFYTHMNRYLERDRIGRLRRLMVVLGRINESEDDELAYAYYAANAGPDEPYERRRYTRAHARRVYRVYRKQHLERMVSMSFKAAGIRRREPVAQALAGLSYRIVSARVARLERADA
ncbi:MAG: acyl-ACP desaturase [Alphaproteobacteria bacterium]|nr:acyl-ACP desaturase [Alphaproteobacteria bacterium]